MLFLIPVPLIDFVCDGFFSELADALPKLQSQWQICCGVTSCSMFGDVVSAPRWFLCGIRQRHGCTHNLTFPPVVSESTPLSSIIDCYLDDPMSSLFTFRGLNPVH
jgi:hypothetical protein